SAFELLKKNGAIRYENAGKNAGCWVMSLAESDESRTSSPREREADATAGETPTPQRDAAAAAGETPAPQRDEEAGEEDVKIIVRSNGTVTYVGKDIAYHLWKFALLGKDFGYALFHRYPDGHPVWRTTVHGEADAPSCGHAHSAYAVIDTRQSYLQNLVNTALHALGYHEQADNLHHFAYEVVGLSPRCAEELGVELSQEDRQRPYVEVSGRKGQGVKADDLIDTLIAKALEEVCSRQMTQNLDEQQT